MNHQNLSMRPQAVMSRHLAAAGLFALLKEKPYPQISISDICARGGISRQTFYRNFKEKEEVISYYVQQTAARYIEAAEGNMEKDLDRFFSDPPFTTEMLQLLHDNNLMYLLRDSMLPLIYSFMETNRFHVQIRGEYFREYYARYLADTVVSILETWTQNHFQETPKELSEIMRRFLSGIN